MITYARQFEVFTITKEQALEGYWYFARVREEKAVRYPDFVEARCQGTETLRQLAKAEEAFGHERVKAWLDQIEAKAEATLNPEGAAA